MISIHGDLPLQLGLVQPKFRQLDSPSSFAPRCAPQRWPDTCRPRSRSHERVRPRDICSEESRLLAITFVECRHRAMA